MAMKTKLSDMTEHLFEMAERLLDDEICTDAEATKKEIEKAQAMAQIADQVVKIKDVQIKEVESQVHAMDVAFKAGFIYKPENMKLEEKQTVTKKGKLENGLEYEL